jgi:hypothetical protein
MPNGGKSLSKSISVFFYLPAILVTPAMQDKNSTCFKSKNFKPTTDEVSINSSHVPDVQLSDHLWWDK